MASLPEKKDGYVGKTKYGKRTKLMAITGKRGRSVDVLSASRHEVRLGERRVLDACIVLEVPRVLIGDQAYDSIRWMCHCGTVVLKCCPA